MTAKQVLNLVESLQLSESTNPSDIRLSDSKNKHKVNFKLITDDNVLLVTGDYGQHVYRFYNNETYEDIVKLTPYELNNKCESSTTGTRPTEWRADIALLTVKDILDNESTSDKWNQFKDLGGLDALKLPNTWAKWLRCPKDTTYNEIGETEISKLDDEINFSLFFNTETDLNIFFKFNSTSYRTEIHALALRIALNKNLDDVPILQYSKYEAELLNFTADKAEDVIEAELVE